MNTPTTPETPDTLTPEEAAAALEAEAQAAEELIFEACWHGTVDGEAFDGDPADLWPF